MQPIIVNQHILNVFDAEAKQIERMLDIDKLIKKMLLVDNKEKSFIELESNTIKKQIIDQLAERDSPNVYAMWRKLNIDDKTISYFMEKFQIADFIGNKYNKFIPDDSAEIFIWYHYGINGWDDFGEEFGIFRYMWYYAFFFQKVFLQYRNPSSYHNSFTTILWKIMKLFVAM